MTTLEPELLTGVGFVSDLVSVGSLLEIHQIRRLLEPEKGGCWIGNLFLPKRESGPAPCKLDAVGKVVRVSMCFSKAL